MNTQVEQTRSLTKFTIVWLGQMLSTFGSAMVGFGVGIWLYAETGRASELTWAAFCFTVPMLFMGPIAGTLVDRYSRKKMMIVADSATAIASLVLFILFFTDQMQIWHLYIINIIEGALASLQWPAFSSSVTLLVDKKDYARTSGMMNVGNGFARIIAPIAAAALLPLARDNEATFMQLLLGIDIVTFLLALACLLPIVIPDPPKTAEVKAKRNFLQETQSGFTFIFQRKGLLGLQIIFTIMNLLFAFAFAVLTPMILFSTGSDETVLSRMLAAGSVGGLAGGLAMSIWGGPSEGKRIHVIIWSMALGSLFGTAIIGLGQGNNRWLWFIGHFIIMLSVPIMNGVNQAIWQMKVPPEMQGRVFSARRFIAQGLYPLSYLFAGPLADNFLEPLMTEGERAPRLFKAAVGTEDGAGMALLFLFAGVVSAIVPLFVYFFPSVRNIETALPDHDDVV